MPNRNYLAGRRLEWSAKKELEGQGFRVLRAAGSHGFADLVAVDDKVVLFIQVKHYHPSPKELEGIALTSPRLPRGSKFVLWCQPPRSPKRFLQLHVTPKHHLWIDF